MPRRPRRRKSGTSPSWASVVRVHSHPSCRCSPSVISCGRVLARRRTLGWRSARREGPRNCSSRLAANSPRGTLSRCPAAYAPTRTASAGSRSRRCECARQVHRVESFSLLPTQLQVWLFSQRTAHPMHCFAYGQSFMAPQVEHPHPSEAPHHRRLTTALFVRRSCSRLCSHPLSAAKSIPARRVAPRAACSRVRRQCRRADPARACSTLIARPAAATPLHCSFSRSKMSSALLR